MCGEIDKYIHELAETKMSTDLFGKVNLNAISVRSWNFTSEVLSCRNARIRSGKQQLVPSKPEFLKQQIIERFFKNVYINKFIRNKMNHLLMF